MWDFSQLQGKKNICGNGYKYNPINIGFLVSFINN